MECTEWKIKELEQAQNYYLDLLEKRIASLEHKVDELEKKGEK